MGITLQGAGAAAAGAVGGFQSQRADNRAQREDIREQAEEDRTARDDAYEQVFNQIQSKRGELDDFSGGAQQLSGQVEAIPVPGAAPGAAPGAIPGGQPQQPKFDSRRAAYKDWFKRSSAAAAMAGGLEGLKGFQDYESATSRKQMMGYGMAGVQAMAAGQAGEAVKQLNTMLEVSPEDTGMRFEAFDGKVHLIGGDGKRSEPYNQAQVMGLIESKLKDPENYLAFQEEARLQGTADEVARSNLIREGTDKQRADAATLTAETGAGQLALDEEYRGRETSVKEAQALASLIAATNVQQRAALALAAANNWTAAQRLQIYKDADSWAMEDQVLLPGVGEAFTDDPKAWADHKSDVMNQMTNNPYEDGPTREEASMVSQFLRQPGGVDLNRYMEDGKFKGMFVKQDPTSGAILVDYGGKEWALPWNLGVIAMKKIPQASPPPEDATAKTEEALPVGGGDKGVAPPEQSARAAGIQTEEDRQRALATESTQKLNQSPSPTGVFDEMAGILSVPFKKRETPRAR